MNQSVIIVGMGEMGGVFARGLLRAGHPLIPVTRSSDMADIAASHPRPLLTLVSVAEADLHPVLEQIPASWRDDLCLLQNELLPHDWRTHDIRLPTVISVWFEKKKGQDFKVIVPSPVYGPHADEIVEALSTLDIPCKKLLDEEQLLFELIRKNVYILTTNIAGLVTGGTVSTLWQEHRELASQIASEVIDIQDWLTGQTSNRKALMEAMVVAFEGDPDHKCMGRSAPARLHKAIETADQAGLTIPRLREIDKKIQGHTDQ